MRIISARIFSKFFGGKITNFDKGLPLEISLASQDNFSEKY